MKTKTKIIFATLLLVIIGSLMACEDCLFPDDPAVITNTIKTLVVGTGGTITPSTEVVSGKNSTVNFNPDVGYDIDIVKIDGIATVLTDNLSYTFINVTSNHKIEVTYKKNRQGILMQHTWGDAHLYKRDVGTTEWIPAQTHAYIYTFNEKNYNVFLDGVLIGDSPYILKGDSLIFGPNPQGGDGIRTKINVLTETSWEFSAISKYYQGPGDPILPDTEIRYIYKSQ